MATYFLVHDRSMLEDRLRPALAAAWRQRSFAPCQPLFHDWRPAAQAYARRYHVKEEDILLLHTDGLAFDRHCWRVLAGEMLLFAARDLPEFPSELGSIGWLLAGRQAPADLFDRHGLHPLHQALHGSRDLSFGPALYRPGHAGWNNADDVRRLAGYLGSVDPGLWTAEQLAGLPGLADTEECADELAFAREWFAVLADLYRTAAGADQVIVIEQLF